MISAAPTPRAISFRLDVRTTNELNGSHRDWRVVAGRRRTQRQLAMYATTAYVRRPAFPLTVTLIRASAGRLSDTDGAVQAALKSIRDGVADGLGLRDDDDPRVTWRYEQAKAPRGKGWVEVLVMEGGRT